MSDAERAGQTPLWGDDDRSQWVGNPTENAVTEAIREFDEKSPLTGIQRATAQVCRSLARSIDLGNTKGRAIANEANQLHVLMNQLFGLEVEGGAGTADLMPPETKALMDALATPPRLDTPSASYAPEF